MHIFIDETGSFSGLGVPKSLSLIGALIIPDTRLAKLEKAYLKRRGNLPKHNGEVKGRLLNETQVLSLTRLLRENSAIFKATAIDLAYHSEDGLKAFKKGQVEKITAGLTDEHKEQLKKRMWEFRERFESYSLPLVVQTILTFDFVPAVLEMGMMYFSTRRPQELGAYHWVVDAKGNMDAPTDWEDWWSKMILPFTETRGFTQPLRQLPIGDYSHTKRFETPITPFMRKMAGLKDDDTRPAYNLKTIFDEDFKFSKEPVPGLELVDIVTNATRRALIGNLKMEGWKEIPTLMIHQNPQYIDFSLLGADPMPKGKVPYADVEKHFRNGGRTMLPANGRVEDW